MATVVSVKLKQVVHSYCGATIEYNVKEVEEVKCKDITGSLETWHYLTCPNCGKVISWCVG